MFIGLWLARKEILGLITSLSTLISNIQKVKIGNIAIEILQNRDISTELKQQFISLMLKDGKSTTFCCNRTDEIKGVTGNGTLFEVPFNQCDENSKNGIFTAPQSGTYFVTWKIFLQNITTQSEAIVQIRSSDKIFSFPVNNLSALKDNGNIVLSGSSSVKMCLADTVRLAVKVGTSKDSKTVHLKTSDAQFSGFLI